MIMQKKIPVPGLLKTGKRSLRGDYRPIKITNYFNSFKSSRMNSHICKNS